MAQDGFSSWYLFIDPNECCSKYFPLSSNCPFEKTPQIGYYWEIYHEDQRNGNHLLEKYNHTYYPDFAADTCVNGTDYPSWMVKTDNYQHMYIFHEAQDCCQFWFGETGPNSGCARSVIQGSYVEITASTNTTALLLQKWYPLLGDGRCTNDGEMPSWMMSESFREHYLFSSRQSCCSYYGFC